MQGNTSPITGDLAAGASPAERAPHSLYTRHLKRQLDVVLSCLALAACLPVMALALAAIAMETPGGAIFKQKRVGMKGKSFEIYKIRTMYDGSQAHGFKTDAADWRITRVGKFLRDTKIDELPQLLNVISGDMSLIGPRPLSVEECDFLTTTHGFDPAHPGYIPTVRPGLTGLEQIYRIHPLVYEERFVWNDNYEANLSWLLDLRIFLTTVLQCRLLCLIVALAGLIELAWPLLTLLAS